MKRLGNIAGWASVIFLCYMITDTWLQVRKNNQLFETLVEAAVRASQ